MSHPKDAAISRRSLLQVGIVALAACAAGGASAQQKIAPELVQYQDKPNNGKQCSQCLQFVAPDSCKVVAGKISPTGWCAAFTAKPN